MPKPKAVMNWSGGKDSALALHRVMQTDEFEISYLLTTVNRYWQRVSMHGVRRELLHRQAEVTSIRLIEVFLPETPSMKDYENELNKALDFLIEQGVTHSVFGDIFLEDLREYREKQLKKKNLAAVFPLWKIPTCDLINEFNESGFKAVTVCVDAEKLDESFCGRLIDKSFVEDLPETVDVCGENGEFHSFVFDAPFFREKIEIEIGETVFREYKTEENSNWSNRFFYCDLKLK